jgi:hypothetical protein
MSTTATLLIRQRIIADPGRGDGHDADGQPGDCLRAAVASLAGVDYDQVPHFAGAGESWWDDMCAWATGRGRKFVCVPVVDGTIRQAFADPDVDRWVIGSGPSPRGPWQHVVIVDMDLRLVHDPHPSDAGLLSVDEVFVLL